MSYFKRLNLLNLLIIKFSILPYNSYNLTKILKHLNYKHAIQNLKNKVKMLYHLAKYLQNYYSFFNLIHYISVRAIFSLLSSLALSLILGNWFIEKSKRNFSSNVREYTPEGHKLKNNTPTMGGLFIFLICTINIFLWSNLSKFIVWIFLICLFGFGLIGFLDDFNKIKYKKGISSSLKFRLQLLFATIVSAIWYFMTIPDSRICVPFLKNLMPDIGVFLILWAVLIIVSVSNAVNLTDGLDGLATGPLMTSFAAFSIISYLAGHKSFASYLHIPFAGSAELTIIGAILIGTLLGFLWYNTYPAQIFMGDVGSLMLGAGLGLMALMCRQELLLLICGGIFVAETLSVMIQVFSFKTFGKKIFRMAPIHHHFELLGWSEPKITVRFWIVSMVLGLLTLLTLKIR